MRLYAVADIHGKEKRIRQIYDIIETRKPDLLVIAGDITHYFDSHKAIDRLKNISIPIYAIRGNWDFKLVEKIIARQKNMHLLTPAPVSHKNRPLLGVNGTVSFPFLSKICLRENNALNAMAPRINQNTILVAHPPPRGILDRVGTKFCAGSFGLKRLIKRYPPLMLLCGHIHEQSGYEYYKNTLVVNCAMNKTCGGAIIDCDKNNKLSIEMIMNKPNKQGT